MTHLTFLLVCNFNDNQIINETMKVRENVHTIIWENVISYKKNKKVKQLSDVAILLKKYYRCYTMRNYRINSSRAEAIEEYF